MSQSHTIMSITLDMPRESTDLVFWAEGYVLIVSFHVILGHYNIEIYKCCVGKGISG